MINTLELTGFKRFAEKTFTFQKLTVLAGRNGAGKTSVIHAILLARHAYVRDDGIAQLNGPFGIELGWFEDLVNFDTRENAFSIAISHDDYQSTWTFEEGDTELYASVKYEGSRVNSPFSNSPRGFQYLSAERSGPRITQTSAALPARLLDVGCRGEYAAQMIEKLGGSPVDKGRLFPSAVKLPALMKVQAEQWLTNIARPVEIDTAAFSGTDVVSMRFRSPGGTWVRPTNMGFGVSYTLPIVLAALTAPEDGVLIVENPEAHLHPAGQSNMGIFLAHMASAGVQVILETHSDHVLNGIRRAIGESRQLGTNDAVVYFFGDEDAEPEKISFTETGGVSSWPEGFFDQYQTDVARISRVRRPR